MKFVLQIETGASDVMDSGAHVQAALHQVAYWNPVLGRWTPGDPPVEGAVFDAHGRKVGQWAIGEPAAVPGRHRKTDTPGAR